MFPKLFGGNSPPETTVETNCGSVRGIICKSRGGREFYEWRGIPYAKPPVGELRFASPQPFGKWDGVRDGSKYGNRCPELQLISVAGNEDCLFLNISAPKNPNKENLPVMFYIHGGGFQTGTASFYHADYFMDHDMIVVMPNYRLGILGFLNTGDTVIRGNAGMKDQRLALKWVKDNIEAFGGDPNQITICGESAGGASIHLLMLSPSTKGLFSKAIGLSGVALQSWACESTADAVKFTKRFAQRFGCGETDDSVKISECLRSKSVKELLTEYRKETGFGFDLYQDKHWFRPSIEAIDDEDALITEHPMKILHSGGAHRVPWMVGVNADEGLLLSMAFYGDETLITTFEDNWNDYILRTFGIPLETPNASEITTKLREIYFPDSANLTKEQKQKQMTILFSDALFNLSVSYASLVQKQFSPVYSYYFSRRGGPTLAALLELVYKKENPAFKASSLVGFLIKKMLDRKFTDYGVCHADALAMLFRMTGAFNPPNVTKDPADLQFSKDMVKLWADFVTSDETKITFRDVRFEAQSTGDILHYLDLSENPQMVDEPFRERIEILKSLNLLQL